MQAFMELWEVRVGKITLNRHGKKKRATYNPQLKYMYNTEDFVVPFTSKISWKYMYIKLRMKMRIATR